MKALRTFIAGIDRVRPIMEMGMHFDEKLWVEFAKVANSFKGDASGIADYYTNIREPSIPMTPTNAMMRIRKCLDIAQSQRDKRYAIDMSGAKKRGRPSGMLHQGILRTPELMQKMADVGARHKYSASKMEQDMSALFGGSSTGAGAIRGTLWPQVQKHFAAQGVKIPDLVTGRGNKEHIDPAPDVSEELASRFDEITLEKLDVLTPMQRYMLALSLFAYENRKQIDPDHEFGFRYHIYPVLKNQEATDPNVWLRRRGQLKADEDIYESISSAKEKLREALADEASDASKHRVMIDAAKKTNDPVAVKNAESEAIESAKVFGEKVEAARRAYNRLFRMSRSTGQLGKLQAWELAMQQHFTTGRQLFEEKWGDSVRVWPKVKKASPLPSPLQLDEPKPDTVFDPPRDIIDQSTPELDDIQQDDLSPELSDDTSEIASDDIESMISGVSEDEPVEYDSLDDLIAEPEPDVAEQPVHVEPKQFKHGADLNDLDEVEHAIWVAWNMTDSPKEAVKMLKNHVDLGSTKGGVEISPVKDLKQRVQALRDRGFKMKSHDD